MSLIMHADPSSMSTQKDVPLLEVVGFGKKNRIMALLNKIGLQ